MASSTEMDDSSESPSHHQILPTEIIARVIYFSRNDTTTLASCMRVSSATNQVTIPYLYGQPVVYNRLNPFSIPINGLGEGRISADKGTNLKRVKEVVIHEQADADVTYHGPDPLAAPHAIQSIRIHFNPLRDRQLDRNSPSPLPQYSILSPRKVVIRLQQNMFPIHLPRDWPVDTVVTVMHDRFAGLLPTYRGNANCLPKFENRPKRAVYIFWTPSPSIGFVCRQASGKGRWGLTLRWSSERESSSLNTVNCLEDIVDAVADSCHPGDVLIVNAGQIRPQDFPDGVLDDDSISRQAAFENLLQAELVDVKHYASSWDGQGSRKTTKELAQVKFTFVSLQEYLASNDWTGEFTEEELEPWRQCWEAEDRRSGT